MLPLWISSCFSRLAPMEVTDWPDSMSKRTLAVFCASTGPRKLS